MPYYILKCYLLLKLASHLVRTRTTMEISSTPIAFCVILGIVIMCNTITLFACLLRILALREVKESKLLLAFGQCIMKLLGLNIIFETETNFENLNERKKMKDVC